MPGRGPTPAECAGAGAVRLTADEFAGRFQEASRVLWTVAAGVLGDASEAEDVLQEACVVALGKLDRFERDTHFNAWMARIVRNVALNHARKRIRRSTRPEDPETLAQLPGGERSMEPAVPVNGLGELLADQGAFDDRLLAELVSLRPMARACLLLRTVLDLSYREIATTLELPEGTAMSHVHRARAALRQALAGEPSAARQELEGRTA